MCTSGQVEQYAEHYRQTCVYTSLDNVWIETGSDHNSLDNSRVYLHSSIIQYYCCTMLILLCECRPTYGGTSSYSNWIRIGKMSFCLCFRMYREYLGCKICVMGYVGLVVVYVGLVDTICQPDIQMC